MRFLDAVVTAEESVQGEINEALLQADAARMANRTGSETRWARRPITLSVDGVSRTFEYNRSIDNLTDTVLLIAKVDLGIFAAFTEDHEGWKLVPSLLEVVLPTDEDEADVALDWLYGLEGTHALLGHFLSRM